MFDQNNAPALLPRLADFVEEYAAKRDALPAVAETFAAAVTEATRAAAIGAEWGGAIWRSGYRESSEAPAIDLEKARAALLQAAWRHVIRGLSIRDIATAKDVAALDLAMQNPPEFTLDNIRATFGKYLVDPRQHVLRGIAEAFADLDSAYKSHSRVKIGVAGLPKRIILSGAVASYSYGGYAEGKLRDVLNAVAVLHGAPRLTYTELDALKAAARRGDEPEHYGITLRGFANGNCHLIFDAEALRQINLALAEFYGDALADDLAADETQRPLPGTQVSAKLQYYPSPAAVVSQLLSPVYLETAHDKGGAEIRVLEPSCGCGRILDGLRDKAAAINTWRRPSLRAVGVEYDPERADEARAKGHAVQVANFLQIAPAPEFDFVLMNPPFAGRHYLKHIRHAIRFLKPGGMLRAILPASAWYDHGELDAQGDPRRAWEDLPVASFAECGTNVPTGIYTYRAPRA